MNELGDTSKTAYTVVQVHPSSLSVTEAPIPVRKANMISESLVTGILMGRNLLPKAYSEKGVTPKEYGDCAKEIVKLLPPIVPPFSERENPAFKDKQDGFIAVVAEKVFGIDATYAVPSYKVKTLLETVFLTAAFFAVVETTAPKRAR